MGKAVIGVIVGIVALVSILIGSDLYATENLQFQTKSVKPFDWVDLSTDMVISVCNPTFMPTSFDKIQANFNYKSTEMAEFMLWGAPIGPYSATDMNSRLSVNGGNVLKMVLGGMLSAFSGQTTQFDSSNFDIHLKFDKKILGFIPYSYEKDYPIGDFTSFIHGNKWSCGAIPQTSSVQIQEPQQAEVTQSNQGSNIVNSYPQIDGIACETKEYSTFHIHAHLDIFVDGHSLAVPTSIGIEDNTCLYWLHTHTGDGIMHIESPKAQDFTLSQFLDIWRSTGSNPPPSGEPIIYINGQVVSTTLANTKLDAHDEIVLVYGNPPTNIPSFYQFPEGL